LVACDEVVTKSAPHFGKVPPRMNFSHSKALRKSYHEPKHSKIKRVKGGGFLWLLLKCERELMAIHKHKFLLTLQE